MKKSSLLVTLPVVALSGLLLSGCGAFRSHKAWDRAVQESPLEIPPGLDRPSTTEALMIPPRGANQPTASGATASVSSSGGQITDGFVVADSADAAYGRVGQVLENGSLGELVAHDDGAHTYTLSVSGAVAQKKKGFFGRMFGRDKSGSVHAPGAGAHQVVVSINPSGSTGSEVRAEGNPAAVSKVIDGLKARLGG